MKLIYYPIIILLLLLSLSLVSAADFDNIKEIKETTFDGKTKADISLLDKYKPLEIQNLFGFGAKLWEGYISEHTESCGINCHSNIQIRIDKEGSLIDDVRFYTFNEEERILQPIRNYQFYIKTDESEYEVNDYEWICEETGKVNVNGTKETKCENKLVGTHTEKEPLWEAYQIGTSVSAGTYEIKLEGEKRPERDVDWQIKTNGVWTTDWATWGANPLFLKTIAYWNADNSTGDLIDVVDGLANGTKVGTPTSIYGVVGNATKSDGTSGWNWTVPDLPEYFNITGEYSINFWFNWSNTLSASAWFFGHDTWVIYKPTDTMRIDSSVGGSFTSTFSPNTNQTYMYTVVRNASDPNKIDIYVNGIFNETGVLSGGINLKSQMASSKWVILRYWDGVNNQMNGWMDEIGIWNKSLTQAQITELYNSGNGLAYNVSQGYVTLNSPSNNYISSSNSVDFNCSATVTGGATLTNMSLWHNGTGTWERNQTNLTITGTTNTTIFTAPIQTGEYVLWTCEACDSDGDCGFATENRTISVDTGAPSITINRPTAKLGYGYINKSEELNWSITDTNFQSAWYNYNGTNISVVGQNNFTNMTINRRDGNNVTLYTNDSVGNNANLNREWDYLVFENERSFSATTQEFANEIFTINITYDTSYTPSVIFTYNNTNYTGATSTGSGDNKLYSKTITIPGGGTGTFDFYWVLGLTNSSGTFYYNSYNSTQTINPITIAFCNATYTVVALNFTTYEEATFSLLNTTFEIDLDYWLDGGDGSLFKTFNYANTTANNTNYQFCFEPNSSTFRITGVASYAATGYDNREYFFENATLNNVTQNIPLYLALTTGTDIQTVTVLDESNNPVEGASVRVLRWDIGTGNFYTIGMFEANSQGQGIINLFLNSAYYKYIVTVGGVTYLTTEPSKESSTTKTLRIFLTQPSPYEAFNDIDYSLSYNNDTQVFSFIYNDVTGLVATGCLRVSEIYANSTTQIYYSCVYSTAGTLSYALTQNGTFVADAQFKLNNAYGNIEKVVDRLLITLGVPERFLVIGKSGYVASFLLIGTLGLVGVAIGSVFLGVVLVVAGAVMSDRLGLINIGVNVLYSLIAICILILLSLKRRSR